MVMKLFYISGTGNTLKLAKDLVGELGDVELVKISYGMDFDLGGCDVVGIAYPVYCFGLPNVVDNFVKKAKFGKDAYIFGLASYGALLTSSGRILKKKLAERGYELGAGFAIQMPGNATMVYNVPAEEKREKMYAKEAERIKEIAEAVREKKKSKVETNFSILGRMMSGVSAKMMSKINETAKSFFCG